MIIWPPQLRDVRRELERETGDTADDVLLQIALDAAVDKVAELRKGDFTFAAVLPAPVTVAGVTTYPPPLPGPSIALGTVRLAVRFHTRRRSPDAMVDMGELGSARVPRFDPDIDRLLGIGIWAGPVVA